MALMGRMTAGWKDTLDYLRTFAAFPRALRPFVRRPLTIEDARRLAAHRLEHREDHFLRLAERAVYGHPASPYRRLLLAAGCEAGDLRALVRDKGLEGALRVLRDAGVYVTFEEFKGRKPIVRGGTTIPVAARDFDNPFARHDLTLSTGGSTGSATAVHQDLDYISAIASVHMRMLDAWGVLGAPAIIWSQILPGAGARFVLQRVRFGASADGWCSDHGWFDSRSWLKYDLATLYTVFWLRAWGAHVEVPDIVRLDEAVRIARRLRAMLDVHGRCLLYCSVSRGARVAIAAGEAGIDLTGTTIRVGGEPVTAGKVACMRRAGARVMPAYGAIETGPIGLGCPNGVEVDHMHLASDVVALVPVPLTLESAGTTVHAFNLTSLEASSPKVMINYQIDDDGVLEERACGCPLYLGGCRTSLHTVRSYSKLLVEGVTIIGTDVQQILEEVLPAAFGGTPLDYQLVQDDRGEALTRLRLLVSPRVSVADEPAVARRFLAALRASSPRGDSGGSIWEKAGTLEVVRQAPFLTSRGKHLPLYIRRDAPAA
jgi:hypothetical protein